MNKERIPFSLAIRNKFIEENGKFSVQDVSEYFYEEYLDCYTKSEFRNKSITIETEDSVCSYYIKNTRDDYIKCCYIIPPYERMTITLFQNEELFLYKDGIVKICKDKFDTYNLNSFQKILLNIFYGFLFVFPLIMFIFLDLKEIMNFDKIPVGWLYLAYIFILFYVLNYRYRKQQKLEKKHKIYVEGYLDGVQVNKSILKYKKDN